MNGGDGVDTVVVHGNETGETFTITDASVTVGGQTVDYTAEALTVDGQQGDDMFDVTPGVIPIFIDGGNPIGILQGGGDTLNVITGGASFSLSTRAGAECRQLYGQWLRADQFRRAGTAAGQRRELHPA